MTRKLTISIDDRLYDGLHAVIGQGHIGKFLEDLARPFVVADSLSAAYKDMCDDKARNAEADEWGAVTSFDEITRLLEEKRCHPPKLG